MELAFENGIRYIIEFLKMFLVVVYVWKMQPKKTIGIAFIASIFLVILVSYFYDFSEIPLIYGIISTLIIYLFVSGERRISLALFSYVFISILDMVFTFLIVGIFHIPSKELWSDFSLIVLCNSVSLLVIVLYRILFKKSVVSPGISGMLLPVYILGGVAVSAFLTVLLLEEPNGKELHYRNGILMGTGLSVVFFVCVCILLEYNQREKERLKTENDRNHKLLEMQSRYYLMLLEKEAETRAFRHDVKEQALCMKLLHENKRYGELGKYISEMQDKTAELSPDYQTGNDYVNAIVTDLSRQYPKVALEWKGRLPELGLSYMDTCTLFYNLLKNAFEAAGQAEKKWIKAVIRVQQFHLVIVVSNSCTRLLQNRKGELLSTKADDGHGYGILNIMKCVKKNNGFYNITVENDTFQTEIILPNTFRN